MVGCPVYDRDWILPRWRAHLEEWTQHGVELSYVFVLSAVDGFSASWSWPGMEGWDKWGSGVFITWAEGAPGHRNWQKRERLELMAVLRNRLKVRATQILCDLEADAFLSLDSDILVSPWEESKVLFNDLQGKDAVSPLVYLGEREANAFSYPYPNKPARRLKSLDALQRADVLCAAILMSAKVLKDPRTVYGYHSQGEDFFWSARARECRYDLALDSRVKWKHVMRREDLDKVDRRIGW